MAESNVRMKRYFGSGCIGIFILVLGLFVFIVSFFVIIMYLAKDGFTLDLIPPVAVSLLSMIFVVVGFDIVRGVNSFDVIFDSEKNVMSFQTKKNTVLSIPYGEIEKILAVKGFQTGNKTRRIVFRIFAIRKDGGYFWIEDCLNEKDFSEVINQIYNISGIQVKDLTGNDISKQEKRAEGEGEFFLEEESGTFTETIDGNGKRIEFKNTRSAKGIFIFMLVIFFVTGVETMIINSFLQSGSTAAVVMASIFIILIDIIIVGLTVFNLRQSVIFLSSESLRLESNFFFGLIKRQVVITRDIIHAVRINRIPGGFFRLVISVKSTAPDDVKKFSRLYNILSGDYTPTIEPGIIDLCIKDRFLGEKGTVSDLFRLEKIIQYTMNLDQ